MRVLFLILTSVIAYKLFLQCMFSELIFFLLNLLANVYNLLYMNMYNIARISSFTCTICLYDFSPWIEAPYKDAAEKTSGGNLTINGFLSEVCILAVRLTLN